MARKQAQRHWKLPERFTRRTRQPRSLVEFFARSPLAGAGLNLERKPDYGRPVDL